jgi:hypothetical protein
MMSDLSEASLEKLLLDLRQYQDKTGKTISVKPTKLFIRPAEMLQLGWTEEQLMEFIKQQEENT